MADDTKYEDDDDIPPGPSGNVEEPDELEQERPSVSQSQSRVFIILALFVGVVGFMLYNLFSEDDVPVEEDIPEVAQTPPRPTPAPAPPPVVTPPPAPPRPVVQRQPTPPPPPPPPAERKPKIGYRAPNTEEMIARRKSDIMVMNNPVQTARRAARDRGFAGVDDPNASFAQAVLRQTEAETAEATRIGNLPQTIAQGKIIDAVLETALNTDLPGTLRAIVSRDIYSEAGRNILIPKGSRLIGTYNTGILRGQKRVFILWTRIIRPDGVDIAVGSEAVDKLGRAGIEGIVDNKYKEIFSSALLTSILTFGVVYAAEQVTDNPEVSRREFESGGVERTGSPTAQASMELIGSLSTAGQQLIEDFIDIRPTITIDQGTIVKVFVNRDLIFPKEVASNIRIIK